MTNPSDIGYALSGDVHIAYQVLGNGPFDLIYVPNFISHLQLRWENPGLAELSERLASFSRLILYDKRGTGLSDRVPAASYDDYVDDIVAVMEAVGSVQAAFYGYGDGGIIAMLFAARVPERTRALVTLGTAPRYLRTSDYPWGVDPDLADLVRRDASGDAFQHWLGRTGRPDYGWHTRYWRASLGPGASKDLVAAALGVDIRSILPLIRAPTLVIHLEQDRLIDSENARYLVDNIPNAKLRLLPGSDHGTAWSHGPAWDEIESFFTGSPPAPRSDRVLATVLFVDVVNSTQRLADIGDGRWREFLDRFEQIVKREVQRSRGTLVQMAGDGFLATFDGPARAINCAQTVRDSALGLEIETRAGLHVGEIELRGSDVAGIGVHIGQRISALAGPGEVLVSRTVTDLVAGSGLEFDERGEHQLKGVPGRWPVYAVKS